MSKVSLPREQERRLVKAAQQDPDNFSEIYEHYYPHIRRFFSVKLSEAGNIDDLTSQTFTKALANINRFSWQGYPFSAWLYRIANNLLIDFYRTSGKNKTSSLDQQVIDIPEEKMSMDDELQQDWQVSRINKLIGELDPQHQQIIILKFYEGYTNREIAKQLAISESNVGTIVYRIVKKFRGILSR